MDKTFTENDYNTIDLVTTYGMPYTRRFISA
jgi:hypothetical protein